jgi:crotonobetainyl-CoA:carnitine CoA-transferase CaiB-like acyl-CoA transferase
MDMKQAFTGIKVLAVARVVAAPFAAYQLAMHGADVVTIENPGDGDSARHSGDFGTDFLRLGMARTFLSYNANKRSLTLRINTPEGQDVFRKLVLGADVVIENLRGGTMARYGIGYEDLRKINPRIIFASVTGYGQNGPKQNDPAIDGAIQAASGMMSITGTPESGPLKSGSTIVDYATGYVTAFAIASALFQRSSTGVGQAIDVAMLDTAMTMMSGEVVRAITGGGTPPLVGNGSGKGGYVNNTYPCKEGFIAIAAGSELRRAKLWTAIKRTDIPQDARFATSDAARANMPDMDAEITRTLSAKTATEWEIILNKGGVPAMAVRDLSDAVHQEQLQHRQFFHSFAGDPEIGLLPFAVPTAAFRMSGNPLQIKSMPPRMGQHTDEVLAEYGYSMEDIATLRGAGTV